MAIARQVTVTGAAGGTVLADKTVPGGARIQLRNAHATTSCFIGGDENAVGGTYTSATGYTLGPQGTLAVTLGPNEGVYGLSAVSTLSITVEVFRFLGGRTD